MASQQAANHRGQVWLNESFYQYTLHQQGQDSSPYTWPTLEQFEATVAWPEDWPNFQTKARPAGTFGGGDDAQEEEDMADLIDFLL